MIGALPTRVDLALYQGDDASFLVTVTGLPLTGAVGTAQARREHTADDAVDLTVDMESDTEIRVIVTAAVSAALSGAYVWDLQVLLPDASTRTLVSGELLVLPEVTRD